MPQGRKRARLSHVDRSGKVRMVDVGAKPETEREAVARGRITVSAAAFPSTTFTISGRSDAAKESASR